MPKAGSPRPFGLSPSAGFHEPRDPRGKRPLGKAQSGGGGPVPLGHRPRDRSKRWGGGGGRGRGYRISEGVTPAVKQAGSPKGGGGPQPSGLVLDPVNAQSIPQCVAHVMRNVRGQRASTRQHASQLSPLAASVEDGPNDQTHAFGGLQRPNCALCPLQFDAVHVWSIPQCGPRPEPLCWRRL